jgi:hypothetical protein
VEKVEPAPSKPDAPSAFRSNEASSEENKRVAAILLSKGPSYYVRAYQHGAYLIEYRGRQILATCREALVWTGSDSDGLGGPMTEHRCMYINYYVGKHIPAWKMWRGDKELRYEPFGEGKLLKTSAPVADVLDIIAEAPIGSPLRRPLPKTSPEILKTLHWIQNTLADWEGKTFGQNSTRESLLWDINGCQVIFVYATTKELPPAEGGYFGETSHMREQVNLGDLDPSSLQVYDAAFDDIHRPVSTVSVDTTDKVPAIRLTLSDRTWEPPMATVPSTSLLWELPSPYAARFAKALKHAITLCGGQPSSF